MAEPTQEQIATAIRVLEYYAPTLVRALSDAISGDARRKAYEPVRLANERVRRAREAVESFTMTDRMACPLEWTRACDELAEARQEASLALSLYRGRMPTP